MDFFLLFLVLVLVLSFVHDHLKQFYEAKNKEQRFVCLAFMLLFLKHVLR